ncbi:MAG: hypothetical protein LKE39_11350 [Sphaerochaeta sp.]|jgi:hypothetical protein|nr:hypothetical protein [Sphaerochaeta sp.]MCI2045334.1 hypothetical protein [Sphaerochaeta sp.]MCI2097063.1 hypothetical protein [Sphaerochaeta sp.]MCI2103746.1 hypothetical protein [Sphaerochaeta sp.]
MSLKLLSVIGSDYDAALKQARETYGSAIRIQSRRDFTRRKLFSTRHFCEISFYLVETPEVKEADGKES